MSREDEMELEIKGLCKNYGKAEILSDINLNIEEEGTLALIGPTGSGKTTLLHLIDLLDLCALVKGCVYLPIPPLDLMNVARGY